MISKVFDSTLFDHLDSTWDFKVGPSPSSTWLTFSVDFGFKSPLYRSVAAVFFEEVRFCWDDSKRTGLVQLLPFQQQSKISCVWNISPVLAIYSMGLPTMVTSCVCSWHAPLSLLMLLKV